MTFSAMISAATAVATTVVARRLTRVAHHVAPAGEHHQRHEREGDSERQHHLRQDQRAGGIDPHGQDNQRRQQGDETA